MALNRELIETTKESPEYQNGIAILGQPEDYAEQVMLDFIGYYYVLTIRYAGNVEGLNAFMRGLGIVPNADNSGFDYEDEEALTTLFTYIVGRNSKEYFEDFLKQRAGLASSEG